MIINIVAYRPDAVDTCRGCVMDRSSSDLRMFNTEDINEAAEFIAKIRLEEHDYGREYANFEIIVVADGRVIIAEADDSNTWNPLADHSDDDAYRKFDELTDIFKELLADKLQNLLNKKAIIQAKVAAEAELAKQKFKEAEAERHRQFIISEYNRLNK